MKKYTHAEITDARHCGASKRPYPGLDGCNPEHRAVVLARKTGAFCIASEVEEELKSKNGQLATANTRILNLLAELAETNEKARVNGRLAVASQQDYRRVREVLNNKNACIERLQRSHDTMKSLNDNLHRDLASAQTSKSKLEDQLIDTQRELSETRRGVVGKVDERRQLWAIEYPRFLQLEEAERERDNLRSSFASATSDIWKLQDRLNISQVIRDSQQRVITELRKDISKQSDQIAERDKKIRDQWRVTAELRDRNAAQERIITEITSRSKMSGFLAIPAGQQVVFIDAPPFASPLLSRIAVALGIHEGEEFGDLVARAQALRDQRDSYKLIVKNIREALGMSEVSQGYAIIERAKQLAGSLKEVRRLAMSWLNIVPKRSDAAEYNHAVEVFRGIEKATNPPKLATGENEAAQTTRAASIGCCE